MGGIIIPYIMDNKKNVPNHQPDKIKGNKEEHILC